ncbi:MAG: methylenetetrahydrofolate reductase, partial [Candidatus Poribacteria bacterium]|nr:methylenetetrahydrofolate reductase [Candidatus Poribacteria bacterium]
IRRLEKKVALGATYAMTQPPADFAMIRELREKTRDIPCEMFVGILPLVSHRNAEFLHNEVPGIQIAEDVRQRMKDADDPKRVGTEIAKEYIDCALEVGFRGIYIIPMLRKYEMAYELVEYVRKRRPA